MSFIKNKKILIIGATGRVGKKLLEYSLEENANVSVLVRDDSNLMLREKIKIFYGDVLHKENLDEPIRGQDIIFSCLSGRKTKPDYTVLSLGIQNILESMQKHKVNRILNVAGAGILNDKEYGLRRNRPHYPGIFLKVSEENLKVLNILENSNISYTCVCAPEMPEGEKTGVYRVEIDYLPENGSRISTGDVAHFLISASGNPNYFRKKVGIAY